MDKPKFSLGDLVEVSIVGEVVAVKKEDEAYSYTIKWKQNFQHEGQTLGYDRELTVSESNVLPMPKPIPQPSFEDDPYVAKDGSC